jgi:hypothetical protein
MLRGAPILIDLVAINLPDNVTRTEVYDSDDSSLYSVVLLSGFVTSIDCDRETAASLLPLNRKFSSCSVAAADDAERRPIKLPVKLHTSVDSKHIFHQIFHRIMLGITSAQ